MSLTVRILTIASLSFLIVSSNHIPAQARSSLIRKHIDVVVTTPKKFKTLFCRITISGHTRTTTGSCGPVRQQ